MLSVPLNDTVNIKNKVYIMEVAMLLNPHFVLMCWTHTLNLFCMTAVPARSHRLFNNLHVFPLQTYVSSCIHHFFMLLNAGLQFCSSCNTACWQALGGAVKYFRYYHRVHHIAFLLNRAVLRIVWHMGSVLNTHTHVLRDRTLFCFLWLSPDFHSRSFLFEGCL